MKKVHIIYPLSVFIVVGLLLTVIVLSLQKIGQEGNRPLQTSLNLENLKTVNVWMDEDQKSWWVEDENKFDISDSSLNRPESAVKMDDYKNMSPSMLFILRSSSDRVAMNGFLRKLANHDLKQVLVASPSDNTLKNLRSIEPRLHYAPTVKTLLKWSIYSQLLIEQVYDPQADFIFIDKKVEKILNKRLMNEIKRRNIPVVRI